jgi:hypothetical protein
MGKDFEDKVIGTSPTWYFWGAFFATLVGTLAETPLFSDLIYITVTKNCGSQNSSETFPNKKCALIFNGNGGFNLGFRDYPSLQHTTFPPHVTQRTSFLRWK